MQKPKKQIGVGGVQISALAKTYVNRVLKSSRLTYGPFTQKFEKEFARRHRVKFAIFCNSGTSALQTSIHALKKRYRWKDGDEILVPAITFVASVNTVIQNQMKPVFVDVEFDYFEIDPFQIEQHITKKTRAIMPVHLCGLPCDMNPILKIAKKHRLKIIEDSCETVLAEYHGQPVGSWGDVSCFSTYAAHIIITGVGGFACTNNESLAIDIKSLFNHGRDGIYLSIDDDKTTDEKKLFKIVKRRFKFIDIGYSYRATEMEAALGFAQLKTIKKEIKKRNENAVYLSKGLADLQKYLKLPKIRPHSTHSFQMYPLVCKKKVNRENLIFYLEKHLIESRYLLPLLNQPAYKQLFGDIEKNYPVAEMLSKKGFYIGCHPGLTKKELNYIIYCFHNFLFHNSRTP